MCNCNSNKKRSVYECGCDKPNPCDTKPCGCKFTLSTKCITNEVNDFCAIQVAQGASLEDVLSWIDNFMCNLTEPTSILIKNIGGGVGTYAGVDVIDGAEQFRSFTESDSIDIDGTNPSTISLSVNENWLNTFITNIFNGTNNFVSSNSVTVVDNGNGTFQNEVNENWLNTEIQNDINQLSLTLQGTNVQLVNDGNVISVVDICPAIITCIQNNPQIICDIIKNECNGTPNLPPSNVGDNTITVPNRALTTLTVPMFTTGTTAPYADPENNPMDALRIDTLPVDGILLYNSIPVILGQIISSSDIALGLFEFQSPNQNTINITNFNFSLRDTGSLIFVS